MVGFGFLAALPAIGSVLGSIFGGAAKGAGDSRANDNLAAAQNNRTAADIYGTQQGAVTSANNAQQQALMQALLGQSNEQTSHANTDLDRRNFTLNAPSTRGRQALLGSLMQNMQPVSMSGGSPQMRARMPQFSGGLNASAIGPMARQMGGLMQSGAVSAQQKGDTFDPLKPTNFQSGVLDPTRGLLQSPQLAELQRSGLLEQILGGLGLGGSLLGALGKPKPQQPGNTVGTDDGG
jgi:hypothetical protein